MYRESPGGVPGVTPRCTEGALAVCWELPRGVPGVSSRYAEGCPVVLRGLSAVQYWELPRYVSGVLQRSA